MRSSSIVAMTAAAALCLSAGLANAAPGPLAAWGAPSGGAPYTNQFGNGVMGAFTDLFTFTNPASPTFVDSGSINQLSLGNATINSISVFEFTNAAQTAWSMIATLASPTSSSVLNFILPGVGNGYGYGIQVDGTTNPSTSTVSYSGNIMISEVPEPKTYAMLLAGLGLLAFTARRRKASFF